MIYGGVGHNDIAMVQIQLITPFLRRPPHDSTLQGELLNRAKKFFFAV
jgi:hypothetical protein